MKIINFYGFLKSNIKKIIQISVLFASYNLTKKSKKKIIIGVKETANILLNMKSLFGDDCITVCKYRNKFYTNNKYDVEFNDKKIKELFFTSPFVLGKLAKNARFFIYLSDSGFLFDREMDFEFLKNHNIPIICNFLGSDIRSPKLFLNYCNSINFNTYIEYDNPRLYLSDAYDNKIKKIAEQADKYASIIFSQKHDQYSYLKSKQYFFPPLINERIFSFIYEKFVKRPLKVVHAPTDLNIKGTPIVRSVVRQLKEEGYDFQYIELIDISNEAVINELKYTHIVLNQFYLLLPGIFGLEAMATGNAVLMSAKPEELPYQFNNAWMETEDWQLYRNLKYLLDHPDKIVEYAQNGYEYITKNFSKSVIHSHLMSIFHENGIRLKKE